METGGFVHDAIDKYYKHYRDVNATENEIILAVYGELKKVWDRSLRLELLKKAYDCIVNFAEWEYENISTNPFLNPLSEVEIPEEGYFGKIDYVDLINKKVIDWKTNTKAMLSHGYRMQASIYKILYEAHFKEELTHFYFFFMYPNEWRTVKFGNEKQKKADDEVRELTKKIQQSHESGIFPKEPRTKNGCNNCNYKYYCRVLNI